MLADKLCYGSIYDVFKINKPFPPGGLFHPTIYVLEGNKYPSRIGSIHSRGWEILCCKIMETPKTIILKATPNQKKVYNQTRLRVFMEDL